MLIKWDDSGEDRKRPLGIAHEKRYNWEKTGLGDMNNLYPRLLYYFVRQEK